MSADKPPDEEARRTRSTSSKGFGQSVAFSAGRGALLIGVAIIIGIVLLQVVDNPSPTVGDGGGGSATETTGTTGDTTDDTSGDTTETTTPADSALPPAEVTVQVLNGSGVQGAAGALTTTLQAFGYAMLEAATTDSSAGDVIYCSGGFDAEAVVLATNVGGDPTPTIEAMPDPRPSGADTDANCLVVLGAPA